MGVTIEALARRLAQVEQEVTHLKHLIEQGAHEETPAARGARLLAQARHDKAQLQVGVAKAFVEMGVHGAPVLPAQLRQMIAACGMQPEENVCSRGIIEMREE